VQYEFSAVGQFESQSNRFVNTGRQGFTNGLPIAAQTTTKANWAGRTPTREIGQSAPLPNFKLYHYRLANWRHGGGEWARIRCPDKIPRGIIAANQSIIAD